jgi:hypothetical protein
MCLNCSHSNNCFRRNQYRYFSSLPRRIDIGQITRLLPSLEVMAVSVVEEQADPDGDAGQRQHKQDAAAGDEQLRQQQQETDANQEGAQSQVGRFHAGWFP